MGSRTRHTPLWHITLTSLLTRDVFDTHPQVTPRHNSNRPLLFIHVRLLMSTDKQPSLNLSVFLWASSSFSHRADRYNTNPTPTNRQLMTLNHSRHRRHCRQHSYKQTHWHADTSSVFTQLSTEILPWRLVFQIHTLPPLVLPFHDSSSLFLSICDVFSLFFSRMTTV